MPSPTTPQTPTPSSPQTNAGSGSGEFVRLAALVTGGAKRVGRAVAVELARAGYDVAIHYRTSESEACAVASQVESLGRKSTVVSADLNRPESWPAVIDQTVAQIGRLDVLVNNASEFSSKSQDSLTAFNVEVWERLLRTNLVAPAALCHYAEAWLRASGRGCIVNLCDISADQPWSGHLAYCASKAGLVSLTKSLARAFAPAVRVNGVAPGIAVFPDTYDKPLRDRLVSDVPLAREGTPEEVAGLVRFLVVSGEYITGQVIPIDGGRSVAR